MKQIKYRKCETTRLRLLTTRDTLESARLKKTPSHTHFVTHILKKMIRLDLSVINWRRFNGKDLTNSDTLDLGAF